MGTRCRLLFGATDGAPTSAEEWFVCFHTSGVSPILGTDGPAPAGRSFPVQSQRSNCAINSLAVLAGAPRTVAVCSCYRTKRKPQPMGTTRRAVTHTCERSTAPGLSCAALLRVQTQGSEYVPVVCCQVYTACLVIGCSGFSGACCRQQTALWSQGHPPCARTHQAAQHREVPDELAVVEPVRGRNVLEHLCEPVNS
jgi:hypothetical protein